MCNSPAGTVLYIVNGHSLQCNLKSVVEQLDKRVLYIGKWWFKGLMMGLRISSSMSQCFAELETKTLLAST